MRQAQGVACTTNTDLSKLPMMIKLKLMIEQITFPRHSTLLSLHVPHRIDNSMLSHSSPASIHIASVHPLSCRKRLVMKLIKCYMTTGRRQEIRCLQGETYLMLTSSINVSSVISPIHSFCYLMITNLIGQYNQFAGNCTVNAFLQYMCNQSNLLCSSDHCGI